MTLAASFALFITAILALCSNGNDTEHHVKNNNVTEETGSQSVGQQPVQDVQKLNPLVTSVEVKTANPLNVHPFNSEVIFKEGGLVGKWDTCGRNAVQFGDCVVFETFVDRLSVVYTYDIENEQEYVFSPPVVSAVTKGAKPSIENFDHDGGALGFTIFFNCVWKEAAGNSTEVFELKIPVLDDFSVETRFTKQCSSGIHPYVQLGMKNRTKERVVSKDDGAIQVGPNIHSSEFFIRVLAPAVSIVHGVPKVISDGGDVGVKLRGISHKTDIIRGKDLSWWLIYECEKSYEAHISVTIPIPPWDDLKLKVAKKCSGDAPTMLNIGTAFGLDDIVQKGVTTAEFNLTNAVGYTHGETHVVGKEEHVLRLYFKNRNVEGEGDLHLGKLHITESDKSVARAQVGFHRDSELGVVVPGDGRMEVIRFVCVDEGKVKVVFSLPVLQFRVVEFCVIKECEKPHAVTRWGLQSLWTVAGLEDMFFVLAGVLAVVYCIRMRKGPEIMQRVRGQRYERAANG